MALVYCAKCGTIIAATLESGAFLTRRRKRKVLFAEGMISCERCYTWNRLKRGQADPEIINTFKEIDQISGVDSDEQRG